jgi:transposase
LDFLKKQNNRKRAMSESSLTELFCQLDDFCQEFEPQWREQEAKVAQVEGGCAKKRRRRTDCLSVSELMTLVVMFHRLRFRQFKSFYTHYALKQWRGAFPRLPSYNRCVELLPRCAIPLTLFFETIKGSSTGIAIVDATSLSVCDNKRISRHRVFKDLAARGKTSMGWFYGFKLHAVINSNGELLAIKLTAGNVDDRKPVPELCRGLSGQLYADKGYIAQWLNDKLAEQHVQLITTLKKNMKPVSRTDFEKALLQRRSLIETVFDQLKNLCQIEHTRHRSVANFVVNLISGIVAYSLNDNKPSLDLAFGYATD